MLVNLGHTTNFVIQYDNKLKDGKRHAQALKSTCKADFAQLRSWFTTTGGFGPKNRVTISIISTGLGVPTANIRSVARWRYRSTDSMASRIRILPMTQSAPFCR